MCPIYGRSKKGTRAYGERPGGHRRNVSVIGAIRSEGTVALETLEGSVNGSIFVKFIKDKLIPRLRPGDLVIMDNLKVHYHTMVKPLIESVDADLLYLPPYSPELNPIENIWSVTKHYVRKQMARSVQCVRSAIRSAWHRVAKLTLENVFRSCGYL
jgi:transposase